MNQIRPCLPACQDAPLPEGLACGRRLEVRRKMDHVLERRQRELGLRAIHFSLSRDFHGDRAARSTRERETPDRTRADRSEHITDAGRVIVANADQYAVVILHVEITLLRMTDSLRRSRSLKKRCTSEDRG